MRRTCLVDGSFVEVGRCRIVCCLVDAANGGVDFSFGFRPILIRTLCRLRPILGMFDALFDDVQSLAFFGFFFGFGLFDDSPYGFFSRLFRCHGYRLSNTHTHQNSQSEADVSRDPSMSPHSDTGTGRPLKETFFFSPLSRQSERLLSGAQLNLLTDPASDVDGTSFPRETAAPTENGRCCIVSNDTITDGLCVCTAKKAENFLPDAATQCGLFFWCGSEFSSFVSGPCVCHFLVRDKEEK